MPCTLLEAIRSAVNGQNYKPSKKISELHLGKPGRPSVAECEQAILGADAEVTYEQPDGSGRSDTCYVWSKINGRPVCVMFTMAEPWTLISGWFPRETHPWKWEAGSGYKERAPNELPAMWRRHDCRAE